MNLLGWFLHLFCISVHGGAQFLGQTEIVGEAEEARSTLIWAAVNQITNPHNSIRVSENCPRLLLLLENTVV